MKRPIILATLSFVAIAVSGCDSAPGHPKTGSEIPRPSAVLNFDTLYQQNCAGCHGSEGKGGAAIALNSSTYLEIADDATIRRVTSKGVPGTSMPAFAQSSGGMLTDEQVSSIVAGIRSRWSNHSSLERTPPSYTALSPGDRRRGLNVYDTFCSPCHGANGRGGKQASSIVDESFLSLVSDQYLRTIVIAGRPELGAPDWRGNVFGRPMSEQEVSDVVAWLSAQRPNLAFSASTKSLMGGTQ
jgi:cytochrome c oxidase cbb3-type subunit 3